MRVHWCSSDCTQTDSEDARQLSKRAKVSDPDVEMAGSGLPSGSGGKASRGEGARESTRTETEAARSSGETLQPGSGEPIQPAPEDAETRRGLKKSAELPIDDPRSEVRGLGLHLDDDVPTVTPTVQQTERPADAAEAHMSMGKMELISNAAAKMMNAVMCELTSAKVWTLAKTAIELFGASVSTFANKSKSCGIDSTLIIDLTARRDDGQFWVLGSKKDRERLEQMQQEYQTELLIGSAPCISFRTLLHPCGTKTQTDRVQDQERQHTPACIKAYKRQLIMGKDFWHEHPVHASSWCMPEMQEFLNDGRIHLVQGPMCHWRLASTGDGDEQGFVRGKTRWATSSSRLAALLAKEHDGENRRVRLIDRNEMIAASTYSPKFVNEALRVLGKQLIDDGRLDSVSLYSAGPTADFPDLDTREWQEDDYDQQGNLLDPIKVKEGKREEIEWVLKQKLFDYVPPSECAERQGRLYSLEWVLKNKGEKVRARLVVREIKKAKSEHEKLEPSDVFSAMPPVESMKALVSHVMAERAGKRGRILVLAVFDVSRAHFYGVCERDVYVEPPAE